MTTESNVESNVVNRVEPMSKPVSNRCRNVEIRVVNRVETDWKTVPAIAAEIGVEASTVLRWIARGIRGVRLVATRVGGRWRIDPADLDRFHAAQTRLAVGDVVAIVTGSREDESEINRAHRERVKAMLGG